MAAAVRHRRGELTVDGPLPQDGSGQVSADAAPTPCVRDPDIAIQDASFFQLVEDWQRRSPGAAPAGSTDEVDREVIRFRANPTFAFPPDEVASVALRPGSAGMLDMRLNLIGLYGPASPLPTIFTERVLDAETGSAVADFLDVFNHRFAGLLVRIWKHYRHDLRYRPGGSDTMSIAVGTLFGLLARSVPTLDRQRVTMLPYAGLLAMGSRSAQSASRILGHFLDLPCRIEEFVPRRIELPPEALFRLGSARLFGVETLIGDSIADVTTHCRIWIGPMTFERYLDCLPDGADFARMQHAIEFVINEPVSRELGLVLAEGAAPPWRLGEGKLAWTSWVLPPQDETVCNLI